MNFRRFFAACAAVVLCATLVETVEAYPVTARTGITTVTGVYRPLDLNLSLSNGNLALDYCSGCDLSYTATYSGTYSGYPGSISDVAGNWELSLFAAAASVTEVDANTLTLAADLSTPVGRLTYLGGGDYTGIPYADTPQVNDFFDFYATSAGNFLQVTCSDGIATCTSFVVQLLQDLEHRGPYIFDGWGDVLDDGTACMRGDSGDCIGPIGAIRVNQACIDAADGRCGTISKDTFSVTSVPEPASLALVGVALGALAWGRRRRQPRWLPA